MRLRQRPTRIDGAPRPETEADSPLVLECDAFLAGRLARRLRDDERLVPVWARANQVAHAGRADLQATARGEDPAASAEEVALAQAVLAVARTDDQLARLQRDELIPLELFLAGAVVSPRRLVELFCRVIYD